MTQEEKELLIKDLCARLPYGVKCQIDTGDADVYVDTLYTRTIDGCCCFLETIDTEDVLEYGNIKPYLFPLSSMTEDQKDDLICLIKLEMHEIIESLDGNNFGIDDGFYKFNQVRECDWLTKKHFDYRGLISRGLAIDATGLNIY